MYFAACSDSADSALSMYTWPCMHVYTSLRLYAGVRVCMHALDRICGISTLRVWWHDRPRMARRTCICLCMCTWVSACVHACANAFVVTFVRLCAHMYMWTNWCGLVHTDGKAVQVAIHLAALARKLFTQMWHQHQHQTPLEVRLKVPFLHVCLSARHVCVCACVCCVCMHMYILSGV